MEEFLQFKAVQENAEKSFPDNSSERNADDSSSSSESECAIKEFSDESSAEDDESDDQSVGEEGSFEPDEQSTVESVYQSESDSSDSEFDFLSFFTFLLSGGLGIPPHFHSL